MAAAVVVVTVCSIILFTMFFESAKNKVEHWAKRAQNAQMYQPLFHAFFGEFTILGFISVCFFVMTKSHLMEMIADAVGVEAEPMVELFETVHMVLFFVMVIWTVQFFLLLFNARHVERKLKSLGVAARARGTICRNHVDVLMEIDAQGAPGLCEWERRRRHRRIHEESVHYALLEDFIQDRKISEDLEEEEQEEEEGFVSFHENEEEDEDGEEKGGGGEGKQQQKGSGTEDKKEKEKMAMTTKKKKNKKKKKQGSRSRLPRDFPFHIYLTKRYAHAVGELVEITVPQWAVLQLICILCYLLYLASGYSIRWLTYIWMTLGFFNLVFTGVLRAKLKVVLSALISPEHHFMCLIKHVVEKHIAAIDAAHAAGRGSTAAMTAHEERLRVLLASLNGKPPIMDEGHFEAARQCLEEAHEAYSNSQRELRAEAAAASAAGEEVGNEDAKDEEHKTSGSSGDHPQADGAAAAALTAAMVGNGPEKEKEKKKTHHHHHHGPHGAYHHSASSPMTFMAGTEAGDLRVRTDMGPRASNGGADGQQPRRSTLRRTQTMEAGSFLKFALEHNNGSQLDGSRRRPHPLASDIGSLLRTGTLTNLRAGSSSGGGGGGGGDSSSSSSSSSIHHDNDNRRGNAASSASSIGGSVHSITDPAQQLNLQEEPDLKQPLLARETGKGKAGSSSSSSSSAAAAAASRDARQRPPPLALPSNARTSSKTSASHHHLSSSSSSSSASSSSSWLHRNIGRRLFGDDHSPHSGPSKASQGHPRGLHGKVSESHAHILRPRYLRQDLTRRKYGRMTRRCLRMHREPSRHERLLWLGPHGPDWFFFLIRTSTLFTIIYLALAAYLLAPEIATGESFLGWPLVCRVLFIGALLLPSFQRLFVNDIMLDFVTVMGVEEKKDWKTIRQTLAEHKTAKCVTALKLLNGMSVRMQHLVRVDKVKKHMESKIDEFNAERRRSSIASGTPAQLLPKRVAAGMAAWSTTAKTRLEAGAPTPAAQPKTAASRRQAMLASRGSRESGSGRGTAGTPPGTSRNLMARHDSFARLRERNRALYEGEGARRGRAGLRIYSSATSIFCFGLLCESVGGCSFTCNC